MYFSAVAPDVLSPLAILVVRFSAIGDILLTTPLLRALRARHPEARITVLTKRRFAPLVSDNPNLDEVVGIAPGEGVASIARRLRGTRYSHLLDLHGSLRSRALRAVLPGHWSGYAKRRIAREILILAKRDHYPSHRPVAERYFEAAAALGVVPDGGPPDFALGPEAEERADAWLARARAESNGRFVAIAPGAAHATKRWPPAHWVELTRRLIQGGSGVVVLGGPEDAALAGAIVERAGGGTASAAGELGLQASGAVIRRAAALVSGDTGAMHMATGTGTPVVALFGPTVGQFGFFPYNARATVLQRDLSCRPCSSKGGPVCPLIHHRCLREITPEAVYATLCRSLG